MCTADISTPVVPTSGGGDALSAILGGAAPAAPAAAAAPAVDLLDLLGGPVQVGVWLDIFFTYILLLLL